MLEGETLVLLSANVLRAAMALLEFLQHRLKTRQRLLGVDLGTKTIGLALSDIERRIATPLETRRRSQFTADAEYLSALIRKFEVGALVLGLPLNMDASEGPRAQSTRAFARNLGPRLTIPIVFWDERLSTAAVTRALIEQDASRAKRAKIVDRMAAAYILQGALDRLQVLARNREDPK
jgi:putative holliday junction resolvase